MEKHTFRKKALEPKGREKELKKEPKFPRSPFNLGTGVGIKSFQKNGIIMEEF